MKMRLIVLLILMLSVISVKSQVEISLIQPTKINFIESDLISDITCIPLQYQKLGTISPDMELKVDGTNYFILDNKVTQNVFHFNEMGELLNTITSQKQVSGENTLPILNNPAKFNINPSLEQVEIFSFEDSALNRFTYSGKKIDKIVFPLNPSDFIRDNKGNYWIYTGWNNKSQFRLIHADQNGKVIERQMRKVTKCTPIESYAFSSNKSVIFLWELLGNSTFKIENNNLSETFHFNYGIKNLTEAFHSMNAYDSYQMLTRNGYYSIKKYLENDNYAYFFLNYTSETGKEMFHIIYEKKGKQIYRFYENAAIGAFEKAQALTDDNELIFLVSPRKIRQLSSSETDVLPSKFDQLVEISNSVKNTMIVKIKLPSPDNISKSVEN